MAQAEAGKDDVRRPTDEAKVRKNWVWPDKPCTECGNLKCQKVKYPALACSGKD